MTLSDKRIDDLARNYGLDWLDYEPFARAIAAEVRKEDEAELEAIKSDLNDYMAAANAEANLATELLEQRTQDTALILMLVERLERADKISGYQNNKAAIKAGRARLGNAEVNGGRLADRPSEAV